LLSLEQLSKLRFGMSELPKVGGAPGAYEELWGQWFLEQSFFRDFTYRNPRGRKKGEELADAVVLFDDVALLVQVKAQCGNHEPKAWATEATLKALKQVQATHSNLLDGHIKKLKNDYYGELDYDRAAYPNTYGIIILAQDPVPFVAEELVPEIKGAGFPIHAFSLDDFALLATRFDTAGDFIQFIEMRTDIGSKIIMSVHKENENIEQMIPYVGQILRAHMPATPPEVLLKSVLAFVEAATGQLLSSPDWRYGLAIDDMIARAHDVDPDLPWNSPDQLGSLRISEFLGWLTRRRRIALGKKIISQCEDAGKDSEDRWFTHFQKSRGTVAVYVATTMNRPHRVKLLQILGTYAQWKYRANQAFGVATEPIGAGRSYDFMLTQGSIPPEIIENLRSMDDPFTTQNSPLI
jgi:hypothetical protein